MKDSTDSPGTGPVGTPRCDLCGQYSYELMDSQGRCAGCAKAAREKPSLDAFEAWMTAELSPHRIVPPSIVRTADGVIGSMRNTFLAGYRAAATLPPATRPVVDGDYERAQRYVADMVRVASPGHEYFDVDECRNLANVLARLVSSAAPASDWVWTSESPGDGRRYWIYYRFRIDGVYAPIGTATALPRGTWNITSANDVVAYWPIAIKPPDAPVEGGKP